MNQDSTQTIYWTSGCLRWIMVSCSCLAFSFHAIAGQQQENFIPLYKSYIYSPAQYDDIAADSIFAAFMHQLPAEKIARDTLVPNIINWHFKQVSARLSPEAQIELLHQYRPAIDSLAHPDPLQMAWHMAFYVRVYNTFYQLDSVASYLDHIGRYLEDVKAPTELHVRWWYEKGRLTSQQGDFAGGLNYVRRGLDYLDAHLPHLVNLRYLLLNSIGIAYRRIGLTDEAIQHYEDQLALHNTELERAKMKGAFLNNLGLAYKDCGDYEAAIASMQEAIAFYKTAYSPAYPDIGSGYDNIAICYEALGDPARALVYSNRSIEFIKANLGAMHPDLLLPMNSITFTHLEQHQYEAAWKVNQAAMQILHHTGWQPLSPRGNYYPSDAFELLAFRISAARALYDIRQDTFFLHEAVRAGEAFLALTDYAYDHVQHDISKEIFQTKHSDVFSFIIRDLYTVYQLAPDEALIERAFGCAEKFKALELLYAAQKDNASNHPLYQSIAAEQKTLQDSIDYYELEITNAASRADSLHLHEWITALDLWKDSIRKEQPAYYDLIYHPEPVTPNQLKQKLGDDELIISYHLAPDAVYLFAISSSGTHFLKQDLPGDIVTIIADFRKSVNSPSIRNASSEQEYLDQCEQYVSTAHQLYQWLLAPIDSIAPKRVIIIPDKVLWYIPFDLLLTAKPDVSHHFRDHPYVLQRHAISYSPSCHLWLQMKHKATVRGTHTLTMAPEFNGSIASTSRSLGLMPLGYNQVEARQIHSMLSGKLFAGQEATKARFLQHASSFPILHLATHGKANDEDENHAWLAFAAGPAQDPYLYAADVYDLDLQASLVTLSACETGLGKLRSGEGLLSLARAFTFAGAKCLVSSLWAVNDNSTAIIMQQFYQGLNSGYGKDIALQQAKLNFLQQQGHVDAHPFYWGTFICMGDTIPLVSDQHALPWAWMVMGVVMLLLLIIILFKKNIVRLGTTAS